MRADTNTLQKCNAVMQSGSVHVPGFRGWNLSVWENIIIECHLVQRNQVRPAKTGKCRLIPESFISSNTNNRTHVQRTKPEATCNNISTVFCRLSRVKFGVVSFMIISFFKYKIKKIMYLGPHNLSVKDNNER